LLKEINYALLDTTNKQRTTERTKQMCDHCGNDHPDLDEIIENSDETGLFLLSLSIIGALVESFTETGYADPDTYKAVITATKIAKRIGMTPLADRLELLKMETAENVRKCGIESGLSESEIQEILDNFQ